MHRILEQLDALNRKERFFLVAEALGNPSFRLGTEFRQRLGAAVGVPFASESVCYMDYHLDWLYAALVLGTSGASEHVFPSPGGEDAPNINANQEDVDLLVGFEHEGVVHLVMIEAKFESSWTTKQFASKTRRIIKTFGPDGRTFAEVVPHFVLASLKDTTGNRLPVAGLPEWVAPGGNVPWIAIASAEAGGARITRCDESGAVTKEGRFWRLVGPTHTPEKRDEAGWQRKFDEWFPRGIAYWRRDDPDHPICTSASLRSTRPAANRSSGSPPSTVPATRSIRSRHNSRSRATTQFETAATTASTSTPTASFSTRDSRATASTTTPARPDPAHRPGAARRASPAESA